jgi:hypothetical protein
VTPGDPFAQELRPLRRLCAGKAQRIEAERKAEPPDPILEAE